MMSIDELRQAEGELKSRIEHLHEFLHIDDRKAEMAELEAKMSAPDFWNDKEAAQNTVSQLSACRNLLEPFRKLESEIEDYSVALELAGEDEEFLKETEIAYRRLLKSLDRMEIMSFLSGKFDRNNLYFSVHAGAGGTESCDWASMLLRMYRRFFERRGWKDEVIDLQPGEEAGVKSATLHVTGEFAYGYMKGEKGVHRLVRISPFDSNARRHTSFVSVDVFPELDDDIDIEIDETQLRIDTYRSQHKNRATAMKMLKAKLYEYEEEKRRSEADAIRGEKMENGWGSQIRSYVLQPYQMVKDLRTEVETSNTAGVLDGEIDEFIEAFLKAKK